MLETFVIPDLDTISKAATKYAEARAWLDCLPPWEDRIDREKEEARVMRLKAEKDLAAAREELLDLITGAPQTTKPAKVAGLDASHGER